MIHKRKLSYALNYCKGIVCISQSTKNDLLRLFGAKLNGNKIEVIYPPVEKINMGSPSISFAELNRVIVSKGFDRLISKKYFLFFSTFEPRKNISKIIQSFLSIYSKLDDYKLVLIGGDGWGDVKKNVNKFLAENYPILTESPIVALDYLADKYLNPLIRNSKAVVYPSLYEGFGMPVVEAMQYGIPAITSNVSSRPEAGGDAAIYVNPTSSKDISDAMIKIVTNNIDEEIILRKMKSHMQLFKWQDKSAQHYEFYSKVLNS